jgi:hypothetical protein
MPRRSASRTNWAAPLVRAQPSRVKLSPSIEKPPLRNLSTTQTQCFDASLGRGEARTRGTAQVLMRADRRGIATASHQTAEPRRKLPECPAVLNKTSLPIRELTHIWNRMETLLSAAGNGLTRLDGSLMNPPFQTVQRASHDLQLCVIVCGEGCCAFCL